MAVLTPANKAQYPPPQVVFFDWDGTLVDTLPVIRAAHNHVREVMGFVPWSTEEFQQYINYSTNDLYPKLYKDRAEEARSVLYEYFGNHHLIHLTPMDAAHDLLKAVRGSGLRTGIISNKKHEYLLREISHLGWDHLIDVAVGAGHAPRDKPAPDPLFMALETCSVLPHETDVWYVGDSETDMVTAQAAGVASVLVLGANSNQELIEKYNPYIVVEGCKPLQNILDDCIQLEAGV